jgi:NAD(P)-dependent dehydrogenase (short-subunit alcohol dehydrogenase family)
VTVPLVVGSDCAAANSLAGALGAELVAPPELPDGDGWKWTFADEIDRFSESIATGPQSTQVVVCTWTPPYRSRPLVETGPGDWLSHVERSMALWYAVLPVAAERCSDSGAMVAVVERPAPIDAAGHAGTTAVAEALLSLTRSLARVHGRRGVRVNAVGTAVATAPETLLGHAPALATYPGAVEREVAGAVRMLLSPDASGVTGSLVQADGGRS